MTSPLFARACGQAITYALLSTRHLQHSTIMDEFMGGQFPMRGPGAGADATTPDKCVSLLAARDDDDG